MYGSANRTDYDPPNFLTVEAVKVGGIVSFRVETEAGPTRVAVLLRDGSGDWRLLDLALADGAWVGATTFTAPGVEYFAQLVDEFGNVNIDKNKGDNFQAAPLPTPTPGALSLELTGPQAASGLYTGPVTVVATPADAGQEVELSIDGAPYAPAAGPVSVSGEGLHTVTARSSDGSTSTATFVIDTLPPRIVIAAPVVDADLRQGASVPASFACLDAVSCVGSAANGSPLDTATEGTKTFTVNATDVAGNTASASATYKVDGTAPNALTLQTSPTTPTFAGGGGWFKNTVTVTFEPNGDPLLADGTPGSGVDASTLTAPVTFAASGVHTATGKVKDRAGNERVTSQDFRVDATRPVVGFAACPSTVLLGATGALSWTATDAHSGLATPAAGAIPLQTATLGTKTATAPTATDNVGLTSVAATCTYAVIFDFKGFFSPVENLPAVNVAKAGSSVPIKFSLGGDQGLAIFKSGYPLVTAIACDTGASLNEVDETVTAGSSSLSYSGGQYHYVWKTNKAWAGTCRLFKIVLTDGTEHRLSFRFK